MFMNEPVKRSMMIVDDDKPFLYRLTRAMEARGFEVSPAESVADALSLVQSVAPAFAIVDLRLGDGIGLDVVFALKKRRSDARIILLSGYGNIAKTVASLGIGAVDYLAKPADTDDIVAALLAQDTGNGEIRDEQAFCLPNKIPYDAFLRSKAEDCRERAKVANSEKGRAQWLDLAGLFAEAELRSKKIAGDDIRRGAN
jgi:ActR/RegA family two-component response regulator